MNEAETRVEHIGSALEAAGGGVVDAVLDAASAQFLRRPQSARASRTRFSAAASA